MKNKNLLTSFLPMLVTAALLIIAPMAREAFYAPAASTNNVDLKLPAGFNTTLLPINSDLSKLTITTDNDGVITYQGQMFPAKYLRGIFKITDGETGSTVLTFQPSKDSEAERFSGNLAQAFGFGATKRLTLLQGKDGSIYIADRNARKIYRITYSK